MQKRFGLVVMEAREAMGWTLDQLGRRAGTQKGYISMIETGSAAPPSPKMVKRLCRALGLDYQRMLAHAWLEKRPKDLNIPTAISLMQEAV